MADISTIYINSTTYDIKDATARSGLDDKVDKVSGKGLSTNDYTDEEQTKLAGIAEGAEVNVQADWNVTDTTSDAYIANKPDVITDVSDKMDKANPTGTGYFTMNPVDGVTPGTMSFAGGGYSIAQGAFSVALGTAAAANGVGAFAEGGNTTADGDYSHVAGYETQANSDYQFVQGKYNVVDSAGTYAHIVGNGSSSARSNAYTLDWSGNAVFAGNVTDGSGNVLSAKANIASPTFTGTPAAPTAAAGTNTTQIATTAFVTDAIETAVSGSATYKGVINSNSSISGLSSFTAGWFWIVGTAGTYVGQTCEIGDMIYCEADATSYSASNFNVVQTNIDPSVYAKTADLGDLAYQNSASGSFTPSGSITVNSYTPEGSVSAPTITVTPETTTVNSITAVGSLPSWSASVTNEVLSFSWSTGSLPTKGSDTTVMTGASAESSAPTFTGTAKAPTGSFSGTAGTVTVS